MEEKGGGKEPKNFRDGFLGGGGFGLNFSGFVSFIVK